MKTKAHIFNTAKNGIIHDRIAFVIDVGIFMSNKICGIYKITSPTKRVYIGQSIDIISRWKHYERLHCGHQRILMSSLKKYGVDRHVFDILHQCGREDLNTMEKYYVDLYQSFNSKHGMNLRDGGGSKASVSDETKLKIKQNSPKYWLGKKLPSETVEKIRASKMGQKLSEEAKTKMANSRRGIVFSEEHIANLKISARKRGNNNRWAIVKNHTEESKKKMSLSKIGKKQSKETLDKLSIIRSKPILQFDKEFTFIKEYSSIKSARIELRITNISACLTGRIKTAGGYIWKYKTN